MPQRYDYSYQFYNEDDNRMKIESHYVRGKIDINDATSFRFQWLQDAISGSSPNGLIHADGSPDLSQIRPDIRTGILGALSRQFGDHRVELEISKSKERDYISDGYALSDTVELNQKNTTLSYGINYLDDTVSVPNAGWKAKHAYDWFTGVSQIIDKNTVVSANLTLGYSDGYLNDPYKLIQRNEVDTSYDPPIEYVQAYRENRPDSRLRQILQLEGKHYFETPDGVLDGVLRLGHDDYGVFSQTVQLEWRQSVGEHFQVIPFFRYYNQNAADFFVNTLDGLLPNGVIPVYDTNGSSPNYSSDYRLSSLNAISVGLRLRYQFNDTFSTTASYERYAMSGSGSASDQSPSQSYPSASIWTFGVSAAF